MEEHEHYCCYKCVCCTCLRNFERCGHKTCLECNRHDKQPPLKTKCIDYLRDTSYDNLNYDDDLPISENNIDRAALCRTVEFSDSDALSDMIKKYRLKNKLSQKELATQCGISHSEISRIENGKRKKIPIDTLNAMADLFEISIDDFLKHANNQLEVKI